MGLRLAGVCLVLAGAWACTDDAVPAPAGRGGDRALVTQSFARLSDDPAALLARPEWLSVAPDGRLLVADVSDKNIKVYDGDGRRVGTIGRVGHGPGEFVGLMTAQTYRDSIAAYDFNGRQISVFGPDGRFARSFVAGERGGPAAFSMRVVDDSLFLLVAAVPGSAGRNLLTLIRPDGTTVSSFFNPAAYLGKDAKLIQRTGVVADAAGGVVFAALVGGDSVYAFDYQGRRLAAGPVDPAQPLVTTRALLARNGGRDKLGDGRVVTDGNRNVIGLVALDSASVAMQVSRYDAVRGIDPLDGGTLLVASLAGAQVRPLARDEVQGALLGRDREGGILLMRYTSPDLDEYEVLRATAAPAAGGAR